MLVGGLCWGDCAGIQDGYALCGANEGFSAPVPGISSRMQPTEIPVVPNGDIYQAGPIHRTCPALTRIKLMPGTWIAVSAHCIPHSLREFTKACVFHDAAIVTWTQTQMWAVDAVGSHLVAFVAMGFQTETIKMMTAEDLDTWEVRVVHRSGERRTASTCLACNSISKPLPHGSGPVASGKWNTMPFLPTPRHSFRSQSLSLILL